MPPPAAPPAAAAQAEAGMSPLLKSALQGLAIFMGMQFFMGQFTGKGRSATVETKDAAGNTVASLPNTADIPAFIARPNTLDDGAIYNPIPQRLAPIWSPDSELDITIVVSPTFVHDPIAKVPAERVVVEEKAFRLGKKKEKRAIDTTFNVPKEVQNNGTLWGHFYIGLTGSKLDPSVSGYDPATAYHFVRPLTQLLHKKKVKKTKNLLSVANVTEVDEEDDVPTGPILKSHYHPNFTMSFISDSGTLVYPQIQPAARQWVNLEATGARDGSGQNGWYYPILFVNTFWQLRTHMIELNSTITTLPLHIDLNIQANWLFNIIASIDENAKANAKQAASGAPMGAAGDGSEFEMFKEILLDTNSYLLVLTVAVSVLHMIFEMLAFKSDVSHWRNKKDNVGISVRSILGNVFMQSVIFLYLLDNNEQTSWMIMFGQGMGIVLEFWKITKTVDVRIREAPEGSLIPYRIAFEDKHKLSETEEKTKEYDEVAFKYVYIVSVPLLIAYAIYSLMYETHKSWYSFIIATLVGSVYAYGFLMMLPSLYINYRLKSVAHINRRALSYKFLNTFIDDLFAFVIKMPWLHRLATLRDDVVFFIYIYQSFKYKTDYTRVNEFGQGGDEEELEEKMSAKPLAASPDADASITVDGKTPAAAIDESAAKASGSSKKGSAVKRK